jgi:hypothetical protein
MAAPAVSDGLAINYANSVEIIMRCKATQNRITCEVSSTAQIGLAAFSGAGAAHAQTTRYIDRIRGRDVGGQSPDHDCYPNGLIASRITWKESRGCAAGDYEQDRPFWFNMLKSLTNLRPALANEVDKDPKQLPEKAR